jgi:serine/threonine protein kinase
LFAKKNGIDINIKINICKILIECVKEAHNKNIIIGDLNPFNILVKNNGNTFFIDVDSYQTKNYKHSGKQLDDIRDYLYNGVINYESDYYALAIIIFNLLTNIHPFKGIHRVYGNLKDRIINKITVMDNLRELKVPKFYEPIKDKYLQGQFIDIFKNGARFLIDFDKKLVIKDIKSISQSRKISVSSDLLITDILSGVDLLYITSCQNKIGLVFKDRSEIYEVAYKGIYKKIYDIDLGFKIILTNKYYYIYKDGIISVFHNKSWHKIKNISFSNKVVLKQYENILVVLDMGIMYKLYLDEMLNYNIRSESINIFEPRFNKKLGLIQYVSGNTFLFYNNNGVLNTCMDKSMLQDVIQIGSIILTHEIKNGQNDFYLGGLWNGKLERKLKMNLILNIATDFNIVVIPGDRKIIFLRYSNLDILAEINCDLVDETSILHYTQAGIFISDLNNIWLINKK